MCRSTSAAICRPDPARSRSIPVNSEDEEAKKARALLVPPPLDGLGVAELNAYIEVLNGEITRVKAMILTKSAHLAAAAAFFRTAPPQDDDA